MMKSGIETNQTNGGDTMTTTNEIGTNWKKIAVIVEKYRKLQNMMACAQVTYAMDNLEYELVLLTGLNKYEVRDLFFQ